MGKNIWIWNHYATDTFFDRGGRHYWFAKYLIRKGYDVRVFCASTVHNSDVSIDTGEKMYKEDSVDGIPYIFIRTPRYQGNGKQRIKNMYAFYKGLFKVSKCIEAEYGKPDVILASSVHPLTLLGGIKIAKKFKIRCVCEIRDLWPFSFVQFGMMKENSLIVKLMYKLEKYIFVRADKLIFTFRDGMEYIKDKHWEKSVSLDKVYYINNGIDLEVYNETLENNQLSDPDLDSGLFKALYTGSIGLPNQVDKLVKAAEAIKKMGIDDIVFLIYGDGKKREELENYCKKNDLNNVIFKGMVDKVKVPYVLSKGDVNMFMAQEMDLYKYGLSTNKMFDYLASGKPIISNNTQIRSITGDAECLIVDEKLFEGVLSIYNESDEMTAARRESANQVIKEYNFEHLTEKLIDVLYN